MSAMNDSTSLKFAELKVRLEKLDPPTISLIIHDRRFTTDAGRSEIEAIRTALGDRPVETIDIPTEWLRKLYIFVPPDKLARYCNGYPIVIRGVEPEDLAIRQKHDRHDGDLVKAAKHALEIETFRLTGRQTAVELARNTRSRNLTTSEADHRAQQAIGVAAYRVKPTPKLHEVVPPFDTILRLVGGLIDRGRRKAPAFFGIRTPKDLIIAETEDVWAKKNEHGASHLNYIEDDNIGRAGWVAWNRERAGLFAKAMEHWVKRSASEQPITSSSGEDVTNAVTERMTAPDLMKIALSGDLQPTDIHKNLLIEMSRFEVGRLIGRLSRGQAIELDAQQAKLLRLALIKRGFGCLETQSDAMNFLLADAALTCLDMAPLMKMLDRIVSTGVAEQIRPAAKQISL